MTTWMLWIWLSYNPCDMKEGDMCRPVIAESSKEFFSEKDCIEARRNQLVAFQQAGFRRYTATCNKRTGPLMGPEPTKE